MIELEKRIEKAMELYCNNKDAMHVPPKDTDIDVVLSDCLKKITELKKEEIKYKEKHGQLVGKIHALENKLARYKNPDYVLVPRNSKTVVAIENMVWQQVEASGIDEPIHRLDGWRILDAIEEAVEKDNG